MAGVLRSPASINSSSTDDFISPFFYFIRGFYRMSFSGLSGTDKPFISAGSLVEISGDLFEFITADVTSSTLSDAPGAIYVSESSAVVEYSNTLPAWDDSRQGWYDSSLGRAVLYFVYTSGDFSVKTPLNFGNTGTFIQKAIGL